MRSAHAAAAFVLVSLAACSSPPSSSDGESVRAQSSASTAAAQGDNADTSCQIVLRHTYIDFESRLGPQTDCSSGTCWVIVTVTFDLAMSQSLNQSEAFVLYQGAGDATWRQSAQATPTFGAPTGFRRYQVVLNQNTFGPGQNPGNVSLIPFFATYAGPRFFDHNRVPDILGSYVLEPTNNWTIADAPSVCPGATPTSTLTATFATGWANSSAGSLEGGGKLDVSYDIYRMPATLSCTTDGVYAFATWGYVQFQPSGQVLGESLGGPFDSATGKLDSLPLEFDVPAGTTSAALWFITSSDCTGQAQYDSNYGQNYTFRTP